MTASKLNGMRKKGFKNAVSVVNKILAADKVDTSTFKILVFNEKN